MIWAMLKSDESFEFERKAVKALSSRIDQENWGNITTYKGKILINGDTKLLAKKL